MLKFIHRTCLAALVLLASATLAAADEVRLISTGAVKGALDLIIADFTRSTGHIVKYTVAPPPVVAQRLAAGEGFDVVVQSVAAMADFAKLGGLKTGSVVPVARGGIGMAVHPNATGPDISTADAFKKTLMAAKSIGIGNPAMPNGSGAVIQKIFATAGILGAIKDKVKIVVLDPGQEMIVRGELELGLMSASEVRSFVKYAGPVPAPLQDYLYYEVAITTKVVATGAATALLQMIASPGAAKHWTAARLEPQVK